MKSKARDMLTQWSMPKIPYAWYIERYSITDIGSMPKIPYALIHWASENLDIRNQNRLKIWYKIRKESL